TPHGDPPFPRLRGGALSHRAGRPLVEELRDRRTPAVGLPVPERQTLCSLRAGDLGERVDLLSTDGPRDPQTPDDAAGIERLAEDLEFRPGEERGQLLNLETVAQVGLVHPVPQDRFRVRDAPNRCGHGDAQQLLPNVGEGPFDDIEDVVLADEGHLQVQLRELRLAIGPLVFVAVAADDLEVAIHAGHHQQLFVELRRLRQGVDVAWLQPAGDEEVTSALGCAPDQHRSLDLQKALGVEEVADRLGHPVPELEVPGHPRSAQVQVAVAKPHLLVDRAVFVDGERRWLRAVEDDNGTRFDLDLARRQLLVFGPWWPPLDGALHMDHRLRSELTTDGVDLRVGGVELHLDDSAAIAQIDEDQTAEVAPPVHPAVHVDVASNLLRSDRTGRRARRQAHPPPNIWLIVDSRSRSATLVWVFSCILRITTWLFSRSSGPTRSARRAPRRAALRSFASRRA